MHDYRAAYEGKRILITGGLGFLGSNLARALVEVAGARLVLFDNLLPESGGNRFNISGIEDRVEVRIADARDAAIADAVTGVDFIFNLLGHNSHIDSMTDPRKDLASNGEAHLSLLEACRRENPRARIVHTSTRQIYGRPRYLPVDEAHPLDPVDINGVNTLAGEGYHRVYHRVFGVRSLILRLTNTYGPRQLVSHSRQGFIGWFVRRAVAGEELEVYGDGAQLRDLNYVDDVIDALLRAGASDGAWGEVFNLGDAQPVSLLAIARLLVELTGRGGVRLVPFPEEKRRIDIGSCHLSFAKAEAALGWRPRTPLREGLARTVEFYRQSGAHYW